jgi:hypothetical protein
MTDIFPDIITENLKIFEVFRTDIFGLFNALFYTSQYIYISQYSFLTCLCFSIYENLAIYSESITIFPYKTHFIIIRYTKLYIGLFKKMLCMYPTN